MAEIASAYVTIIPSFQSGLGDKIKSSIESGVNPEATGKGIGSKVSGGITGGLSTLKVAAGTFIGNAFTGAFDTIVGAVQGIASEAVEASDATDKFKSTLDFAGVDNSQIEALTASCQKYADETVYDLSDIQSTTAQLAANNVKDFDKLAMAAGNLNAVAGGNKDTFKSVGMVLTQTAGQGKLTTENFNQLRDAIPGASGIIQDELAKMGAYTGNFSDAMAAGEISAEEFNQAIMNLGFQDTAVEAATSATTFEGAMGNIEASVQGVLKNGFDLIKPAVTGVINAIAGFVSTVPEAFTAIGEAMAPFIEQCQAVLGPAIQTLVDKFMEFCNAVAPVLMPVFQGLGEVISFVAPILGDLFVSALNFVIEAVTALVEDLTGFIDWMSSTFGPFWNDTLLPLIQAAWEGIKTAIQVAVDFVKSAIDAGLNVIKATWDAIWNAIKVVTETVFNAIKTVIDTVMGVIKGIITTVTGVIKGDWSQVWEGIKQIAQSIWDGIKNLIQIAIDFVKNIITTTLDGIKSVWDSIWNAIKGLAETVWNGIKSVVQGAIDAVKNTITNVLDGIRSAWENGWNAVRDFIQNAWDGIKNGVSAGIDAVLGFVSDMPGRIVSALGDLGGLLVSAGRSIIDGFLNGLKAAWGAVTDFVGGIASWISSHKGPIEKDRQLLVPAGQAIMQGFGESMDESFTSVKDFVSAIGQELADSFVEPDGVFFEAGDKILMSLKDGVFAQYDLLWNEVAKIPSDLVEALSADGDLETLMKDAGTKLMKGITEGLSANGSALTEAVKAIPQELSKIAGNGDFDNALVDAGKRMLQGLQRGLLEGANAALDFINSVPRALRTMLGYGYNLEELLMDEGDKILYSLYNGIFARWDWFYVKVWEIPEQIISMFYDQWDPNTLLFDVGDSIMDGLARGIAEGAKGVYAELSTVQSEIAKRTGTNGITRSANTVNVNPSRQSLSAEDVYSAMNSALARNANQKTVLMVDGKELAYTTADTFDARLATRSEQVGRVL